MLPSLKLKLLGTITEKKKMRTIARKLAILILLFLPAQPAFSDVILGAPIALTGPVEQMTAQMQKSINLAVSDINAQGGVLGQDLKIIYKDTSCDADVGVAHVTSLVENSNVTALIGAVCSGVTLRTARSVSIPANVVMLSFASASSLITALKDKDLVFRTAVSDAFKGKALAQLVHTHGVDSIAISYASDVYNTGAARAFSEAYESLGGKIAVSQIHEPNADSYKRNAQVLSRSSKQVAIFSYYGSGGTTLLNDILATDSFSAIYGADGMLSDQVLVKLQDSQFYDAHFVTTAFDKTRVGYQKWLTVLQGETLDREAIYVTHSYDAVYLLALAIEAMGTTNRTKIAEGLRRVSGPEGEMIYPGEFEKARALLARGEKINYEGASGMVDFDEAGDITGPVNSNKANAGSWSVSVIE